MAFSQAAGELTPAFFNTPIGAPWRLSSAA